ncbi:MAG: hypothetical protein NTZ05_10950 [Chloroflexi bacterium]|nr:hypothetical protein [Chloroflexota bacterium]
MSERATPTYDSADMAQRGRIRAHRLHATHDSREITANARAAFMDRFQREVDPDGTLPEAERERRAEHAKKAHFARLAHQSAQTRRSRKAKKNAVTGKVTAQEEVRRVGDESPS